MSEKQEKLCPGCETGKRDYELDKHSVMCTYINCLKNGSCSRFVPINDIICK